jgi:ribosomal protein S18 acetylase RimI-like enzyme
VTRLVRPAAAADLPAIERIVRDAYEKYVGRIGRPPAPMTDDYRQHIREHAVWVMLDDARLVGVLVLLAKPDHLQLDNVAVDPAAQRNGIGRALLQFAEGEAQRRGYGEVRLYTHRKMHENVAMYPRLGYEETGRGEEAGFERVFFRKRVMPAAGS